MPRLPVSHPIGKCGDDINPVVTLRLAVAYIIFETRSRTNGAFLLVIVPAETVGPDCIPCIADDEEWGTVGILQRMLICGRPQKAATQGVLCFFRPSPLSRYERT